jgi:hypothetical protein
VGEREGEMKLKRNMDAHCTKRRGAIFEKIPKMIEMKNFGNWHRWGGQVSMD